MAVNLELHVNRAGIRLLEKMADEIDSLEEDLEWREEPKKLKRYLRRLINDYLYIGVPDDSNPKRPRKS